jgi:uncharacterized protein YndB with AHSA1/START domain
MADTDFIIDKANLEVRATRVFDAPRDRVWAACSDPEQIKQWWGPRDYEMIVDKMDFRVGGVWRFVHRDGAGQEFAFNGVYKEIQEPEKIVDSFEFEGTPGHILVETLTLESLPDGKTRMTTAAKYDNLQDLEGMVNSGMEKGQREGIERLAELVENRQ